MGTQPPPKKYDPQQDKLKFEIACIKMKGYVELMRDRKQNEINVREKQLIKMIQGPNRQKLDEYARAQSIVSDMNILNACNYVLRFADILKDRSFQIVQARGKPELIQDLIPFIESIIWSAPRLNLNSIQEFSALISLYFGPKIYESVQKSTNVNEDLKKCYENLLPTNNEVNNFIISFSKKNNISLEQINEAGHEFYPDGQKPGSGPGTGGQIQQNFPTPYYNQPIKQDFAPVAFPGQQQQQQQQPYYSQQQYQLQQYPFQPPYQQPGPQQQYPQYQQTQQQQPIQLQQFQQYPQFQQQQNQQAQIPQYPGLNDINIPSYNQIMNQNQKNNQEFAKCNYNNLNQNINQPAQQQQQQTASNDLPSLNDFEERMRKFKENQQ